MAVTMRITIDALINFYQQCGMQNGKVAHKAALYVPYANFILRMFAGHHNFNSHSNAIGKGNHLKHLWWHLYPLDLKLASSLQFLPMKQPNKYSISKLLPKDDLRLTYWSQKEDGIKYSLPTPRHTLLIEANCILLLRSAIRKSTFHFSVYDASMNGQNKPGSSNLVRYETMSDASHFICLWKILVMCNYAKAPTATIVLFIPSYSQASNHEMFRTLAHGVINKSYM